MSFNEKLQYLRKENKLSQEQLADMLDVTRQSVSKWESGTTYPEMDKLIMLCKIFKCSLDDLTNDEIREINVDKKENNNSNNFLSNILDIINKTVKMFKSMSFKQIVGCIVSMFILALVLLIFRIPFELIENGLHSFIVPLVTSVRAQKIILGIICFILDIIYYALYILVYVYIYKVAYLDKYEYVDIKKKEVLYDSPIDNSNTGPLQKPSVTIISKDNNDNSLFKFLGGLALGFIKCLVVIFSMPAIFILCFLCFLIAIVVYLMFDGIFFLGVLLGLLFASLLVVWFLILISLFIFNRKISFKKMLTIFLGGIIGLGISGGIITLEVSSFEYSNQVPEEAIHKSEHFEREMKENLYILEPYYGDIKYVVDDSKKNISIDVDYYGKMYKLALDENSDYIGFDMFYKEDFDKYKFMFSTLKKCLKEKKIYDFDKMMQYQITIIANKENIETIKQNTKDYLNERKELEIQYSCDAYEVTINNYEDEIDRLKMENQELQDRVDELERFKSDIQDTLQN